MRLLVSIALTVFGAAALHAQLPSSISPCTVFPSDHIWNTPVDQLPLDSNSRAFINANGADSPLHPDFGSGLWQGGPIGFAYTTVKGDQVKLKPQFDDPDESDGGWYPIPDDVAIEGGANSIGDRHAIVIDTDHCMLYELYNARKSSIGWLAGTGASYDLRSYGLRSMDWTSADAAGLPIFPGLVRYDEVAAGHIDHALRMTVPYTRTSYIWPARHYASKNNSSSLPAMGQRFRLKSSVDISHFSPPVQVILQALKTYGAMVADNGSSWYISGVADDRWDNTVLAEMKQLHGSDLEAVYIWDLIFTDTTGRVNITPSSHTGGRKTAADR